MGARAYGDTIDFGVKRAAVAKQWDDADAVANLKYSELPGFKGIKLFLCHRLTASMQPAACAKSFANAKCLVCVDCPIGPVHLAANPVARVSMERHEKAVKDAARWDREKHLACVRCERSGATAKSYVGRFRIVKSSYHLCVGCYNRQREVEKNANSKGAAPKKWAHIREAIVTIEKDGERKTIPIGLRTGWAECGRFVKQAHEGWTLIKTAIDGEIIPQFSLWTPLPFSPWTPSPIAKTTKPKVVEDDEWTNPEYRADWFRSAKPVRALPAAKKAGEWEDDRGIVWNKMPVAPVDTEQGASDVIPLQSDEDMLILDAWPALEADPELGLSPFINWVTEDWPKFPKRFGGKTVAQLAKDAGISTEAARYRLKMRGTVDKPSVSGHVNDIAGQRFGRLLATEFEGTDANGNAMWRFACDCGRDKSARASDVKRGDVKSCGCTRTYGGKPLKYAPATPRATPAPADEICAPVADSEQSVSPAWREVFGDMSEQPTKKRAHKSTWRLPPDLSPEEDAAYRASFDSEPLEPSEQLAEAIALPEVAQPAVEPVRAPQVSPKLAKKQAARAEREARKAAADQQRAKVAASRLPSVNAKTAAIAAKAMALAHIYCHKHENLIKS